MTQQEQTLVNLKIAKLRKEQNIDWEQRTYEIAKAVMQGMTSDASVIVTMEGISREQKLNVDEGMAKRAVQFAKALIKELQQDNK